MTTDEQFKLVAKLGLIEGIKAGAFQAEGADVADKPEVAALTTVTTANATDEATAITLVNALKTKVNQIITALKA
ncbi:head fiber protein [Pseudomonas phage Psxphi15]